MFGVIEPILYWHAPVIASDFHGAVDNYYINSKTSVQLSGYIVLSFSMLKACLSTVNKRYICAFGGGDLHAY